jgi:hypothetical protein
VRRNNNYHEWSSPASRTAPTQCGIVTNSRTSFALSRTSDIEVSAGINFIKEKKIKNLSSDLSLVFRILRQVPVNCLILFPLKSNCGCFEKNNIQSFTFFIPPPCCSFHAHLVLVVNFFTSCTDSRFSCCYNDQRHKWNLYKP